MPRKPSRASCVLGVTLGVGILAAAGCASRSRAETSPPVPEPLRVPSVPPRVVAGPQEPEADLPADRVELPEAEENVARAGGARRSPEPKEQAAPAPKPSAAETEASAGKGNAQAESILSTPETANDEEAVRRIRESMRRASADLGRLDFATLNDNAKKDYRNAEGFLRQAESALANRNLSLASDQADKAEKLARGLIQRSSGSM